MKAAILNKDKLDNFIQFLSHEKKVVAPVSLGNNNFAFQEVSSAKEIALKYIPTILPPKKYFMPQRETILEYDISNGKQIMNPVIEYEELILFAVHTCDLAGIQCLNIVFSDRPKDLNYLKKKNRALIIGLECNEYCDHFATCALMNNHTPNGGYDLFFTDLGDYFYVDINTQDGEGLISSSSLFIDVKDSHEHDLERMRKRKREIFSPEVDINHYDIPKLLDGESDNEVWEELGKRCLACGNCTNVCPTCYCFDIIDEPNLDLKSGKRVRIWDSCQHETFAKVASGENFRGERGKRQRHRFYRKFHYPVARLSRFFCTGCGRCSRTCMAGINMKETIQQLIDAKIRSKSFISKSDI